MTKQKSISGKGVTFCLLLVMWLLGCATTKPKQTQALYTPHFNYAIKPSDESKPFEITIALVNPIYGAGLTGLISQKGEHPHSVLFRQSLGKDLERLLIAKGFKILGPFKKFSEMTYPQKKQTDLVLQPIMGFSFSQPETQTREKTDWGGLLLGGKSEKIEYFWEGPCTISGFINFEVWEPLSYQKMWAKKVDVEPIQEDCSAIGENRNIVYSNSLAKLLQTIYETAMAKADTYFNREEMELVKNQSTELRAKKVY